MREIFMLICFFWGISIALASDPVFEFTVKDGSIHANGRNGKEIQPVKQENITVESGKGLTHDAFRAEKGILFYPGEFLPKEKGSVETWVAPLPKGCSSAFHFFVGGAAHWGPEGLPRLWYWENRPRFDVDPGPRLIAERLKDPSWKPGVWNHLVATYDRTGVVELYVNGELLSRKVVVSWKPVPVSSFAIGSGCGLGDRGRHFANALIDSVRIYDTVLSPEEIRERFRRVKMSNLSVVPKGHSVLTDRNQAIPVEFRNTGSAVFSGEIAVSLSGGKKPFHVQSAKIEQGNAIILNVPGPFEPLPDGTLFLEFCWKEGSLGRSERKEKLEFYFPESPVSRVSNVPVWKKIGEIDAWKENPASSVGLTVSREKNGLRYREGGVKPHNRFAYTLRLPERNLLLRVRVQIPDDKKRIVMLSQSQPDFAHPRTCGTEQQVLGSGVLVGGEFKNSGKMLEYEYIFRHPSEYLALIIEGYAAGQPAAVGKITIESAGVSGRIGPGAKKAQYSAKNNRKSGLYWEDPVLAPCFGGIGGVSYADFDNRVKAAMDYFDYSGQNLILYPTVWYSGPLYRSEREKGTWPVGMRHHPPEYPRLLALRCSERNIRFIATFNLWKLPSTAALECSPEEVVSGRDSLNTVTRTGKVVTSTNWHSQPHLNALRSEVQNAVEGLVEEHLSMYGKMPGFGGIGFALWMGVPMQLGLNLESSYDDWTMKRFSEYRKENLPGKEKSPERFQERSEWILKSPERRSAFLQWRAECMTRFYMRVADRIRTVNPKAELRLILVYPVPLKDSGLSSDRLLEQGLDLKKLADYPGICLDRMVNQTNLRQEEKYHMPSTLPPRFMELSEAFQKPILNLCTAATVHQQYFESHGPLTRKNDPKLRLPSPWKQEALGRCTAPVPVGRNFLGYYANLLSLFDVQELSIGGFTLGLHGVESMVREWTGAFQSLPSVRFGTEKKRGSVLLRSADAEGFRWFYLLNLSDAPVAVALSVKGMGYDTVSGKRMETGTLALDSYGLRAFRMEKGGEMELISSQSSLMGKEKGK